MSRARFLGFRSKRKGTIDILNAKNSIKGKYYALRDFQQRKKVLLVYLECKLQQDSYGLCICNWEYQKTVDRTYLETRKQ